LGIVNPEFRLQPGHQNDQHGAGQQEFCKRVAG